MNPSSAISQLTVILNLLKAQASFSLKTSLTSGSEASAKKTNSRRLPTTCYWKPKNPRHFNSAQLHGLWWAGGGLIGFHSVYQNAFEEGLKEALANPR